MPIKPDVFLDTAESVIKLNNQCEGHVRCSISRSYYSMYHKTLLLLDYSPRQYKGQGSHGSLIKYMTTDAEHEESIDFRKLRSLAYLLKQGKDARVDADYKLDISLTKAHAIESIDSAKAYLELCDEAQA